MFALVRTSNPSSADLQDVTAGDRTVAEHVADRVAAWGASRRGTSGLTAVGAVVGATWPDQARALRKDIERLRPADGDRRDAAG